MGISIREIGVGPILETRADELFPLASVYKVPILATLFRRVADGDLSLSRRLTLKEEDKAWGSDLEYFSPGVRFTVGDLCYLMIVHSDNTATDMLHRMLGLDAPNIFMRSLGLRSFDIHCPSREYFFIHLGLSRRFRGQSLSEIARLWKTLSREERMDIYKKVWHEMRYVSASEMQEKALRLWGISSEKETAEMRLADEIMDNPGSPGDTTRLLELISTNKIAPEKLTRQMLQYMFLCDSRDRLRKRLPPEVLAMNKTGTVCGTVNDCAIIRTSERTSIAVACFAKRVKFENVPEVEDAISRIGLEAYNAFSP